MKKDDLFEAMGDIDEFYIKESESAPTIKVNPFGIGKTLAAAAALIVVFGAALILPRVILGERISPVDTGKLTDTTDSSDTTLDTAIEHDYPTDEEIVSAYDAACEAASWFRGSTLGSLYGDKSDYILIDGQPYWRVTKFDTYEAFDSHLRSLFSEKLTNEFLDGTTAYDESEGKLYCAPISATPLQRNIVSDGRITDISYEDKDTISLIVTFDVYDFIDEIARIPTDTVIGTETLLLLYEKIGDKWVFTNFPALDYNSIVDKYKDRTSGAQDGEYYMLNVDGVNVPLPYEYMSDGHLSIITGNIDDSLITFYHAPARNQSGAGEILRLYRYSAGEYERKFLESNLYTGGAYALATDGEYYYVMSTPTDVQADPSDTETFKEYCEVAEACRMAIREHFAEANGFTPVDSQEFYARKYTYDGEHHLVRYYPYGKGTNSFYTLVLSQPAKQGDGGIWCVERWLDLYPITIHYPNIEVGKVEPTVVGNIHLTFPESGDLSSVEYYAKLQEEFDRGEHAELSDPLTAARAWVTEIFGNDMGYVAGYLEDADEYGLPEGEWTY